MQIRAQDTMKVNKLQEHIGAEVTGVDLSKPVDAETRRRLNEALVQNIALVIRDQKFTPRQFLEAAMLFGEPHARRGIEWTIQHRQPFPSPSARTMNWPEHSAAQAAR